MDEMVNPYIAGAPVTEARMFFGRDDVFDWIKNSLAGRYAEHILVVHGQRRVGKTSVLKQLGNRLPENYIPVFFDLQGLSGEELTRLVRNNFNQQSDSHYAYLWSHCSESEKITLLIILTLGMQKPSKKTAPNRENILGFRPRSSHDLNLLGKRGIIEERGGVYALFSASLADWIQLEILAAPGEEEEPQKAEEWLASGGEKRLEELQGVLPKFKRKYWNILAEVGTDFSINLAASGAFELIRLLL